MNHWDPKYVKNMTRFSSKGTRQILQKKERLFVVQPFNLFFRKWQKL